MATAVGTNINLSALDKELEKLDKALDRFVKHSIDAQNKVNSAFNNMGQQGLKNFEDQLSRVQNKILEIGKKGVTMKWDSQNLARYIDQVNHLTDILKQAQGAGYQLPTANLNKDFQSISALTKELNTVKEWLTKGVPTTDAAGNTVYQQLTKDMQNYLVEYKKKTEEALKIQNQSIMEQVNNVRKALQVELKETEATEKKKAKARQKANETYAGSIKYSNNAKTLEQERQAIVNLEAAREKLKKTDADYATKLETLNKKINEHRINIEAATKTEAQRNALTSSTRAEYARLLAEQEKLRKSYLDLKSAQQVSGPTKENTAALQNIVKRYRDVYAEIQRYKQSANGQLDATERKFLAEQAKLFADAEKRKTDIARKEAIERSKINRTISVGAANKVISITDNAKSVNQHISAIKALENARNKLNNTDTNYHSTLNRLNQKIKEHQTEIDKAKGKIDSFGRKQKDLINISGQLQNRLALMFSVSQITGYVNKLIQVRGEFELQQRALQAIIQDTDEANKLWAKTVELAIHSPFRVKELVTYTKQLAAYRVEADKLYETNKMLADVSAGLGVDMNRLILAFGQVKAANYLRGTELRQFSEAGINILEELAKYFNEVEGKAVSVGDVFEMVSKRMVTFADVEQIFKRITSEGGTFYRMQEIQAETLQGQISNLWDSVDVMLNKIGKANDGILKGSVGAIRSLVENWETFANIAIPLLEAIIVRWGLMKANILLSNKVMTGFFTAFNNQLRLTGILLTRGATAAKAFGRLKGINPFGGWATIISAAAVALFSLTSTLIEHERAIDDVIKKYHDLGLEAENVREAFSKASKKDKIDEQRIALSKLLDIAKKDYDINIDINVNELDKDEILNKFNELNQEIIGRNAFALKFSVQFEKQKEWTITDDIQQDLEQLNKSYAMLGSSINIYKSALYNSLEERKKAGELTEAEAKALNILSKDFDASSETQVQYTLRIIEAYRELNKVFEAEEKELAKAGASADDFNRFFARQNKYFEDLGVNAGIVSSMLPDFIEKTVEAGKEADDFFDKIASDVNALTGDAKENYLKFAIDTHAAEKELGEFITEQLYLFANQRFELNITPIINKKDEKELGEWAKRYNAYLSKISNYEYLKEATVNDRESEFLSDLKSKLEEQEKITKAYLAGAELYTKAEYETADAKAKEYKLAIQFFEGIKKNTKEENEALKKLKSQIDLIKQMRQEFEKLNKTRDSVESLDIVTKSFAEAAEAVGLNIKNIDVSTLRKQADAIRSLIDVSGGEAIKKRAIAEIEVQIGTDDLERENENIRRKIEDMFGGYELYIELEKLNIPPDLAKQLFNVDIFDMTELKEKLQEEIKKLRTMSTGQYAADMTDEEKQIAKDRLKIAEDAEKKITEMERKELEERAKKYVKYLVKGQGERVKIKLEELRAIEEIESLNYTKAQKDLAKQAVSQEAQEKLDKLEWEEFKDSGLYVQLFEDLDHASADSLKRMRYRIAELKTSLKDLDADDLRHLNDQLDKLDSEISKRSPFKTLIKGADDYFDSLENIKKLEKKIDNERTSLQGNKKFVESLEIQLAREKAIYEQKTKNKETAPEELEAQKNIIAELETKLSLNKSFVEQQEKSIKKSEEDLDTQKKKRKEFEGAMVTTANYFSELGSNLPKIAEDLESVFGSMDEKTRDIIDGVSKISSGVGTAIEGFASKNYIQAVAGMAEAAAGFFQFKDKRKERQIQAEVRLVAELTQQYQRLEKQIEKAYSIDSYNSAYDLAEENLEKQIASYEKMIKAEEDKKDTDKNRIKEWELAINDAYEQIEELREQQLDELGAVNETTYRSSAREFVDAWLSAYEEAGNGLSGLEDNFQEFFKNIVATQASMQIVDKFLKPFYEQVADSLSDSNLTEREASELRKKFDEISPQLNEFLETFFEGMGGLDSEASELSGLQRGIQGVTEETAQIIEAYLNSIRFFVADSNMQLKTIASAFSGTEDNVNPMVSQLRIIAQQTTAINSLLEGVTKGGHSEGGRGIKVFIS